jgi:hypothetical protein
VFCLILFSTVDPSPEHTVTTLIENDSKPSSTPPDSITLLRSCLSLSFVNQIASPSSEEQMSSTFSGSEMTRFPHSTRTLANKLEKCVSIEFKQSNKVQKSNSSPVVPSVVLSRFTEISNPYQLVGCIRDVVVGEKFQFPRITW